LRCEDKVRKVKIKEKGIIKRDKNEKIKTMLYEKE